MSSSLVDMVSSKVKILAPAKAFSANLNFNQAKYNLYNLNVLKLPTHIECPCISKNTKNKILI
jgi:hypothetical protein